MTSEAPLPNRGHAYPETVGPDAAGRRVLDHLAARYPRASRDTWADRLRAGEVRLEGEVALGDEVLRAGQQLIWHRPPWTEPEAPLTYAVIHEDDDLVVVDKPSGLPTLPGAGFRENTLLYRVRARYPDARPVHRLGRATSGLVLFARSREAAARLSAAFRDGAVEKRYRALASGVAARDRYVIDTPIGEVPHSRLGTVHGARADGRPSRSIVHVLERRSGTTLFAVDLITGRPHQIRIHLASIGHPLAGDPLYGPGGLPLSGDPGLPGDGGYRLHAERLAFDHPRIGAWLSLVAPVPEVLRGSPEPV